MNESTPSHTLSPAASNSAAEGAREYTLWEAVRDAWSHGYVVLIDGHIVLNTERSYHRRFYPLMSSLRGWRELEPRRVERHKMFARAAIKVCAKKVARILQGNGLVQL